MTEEFTQRLLQNIADTLHKPVEQYRLDASFEELGIDSLDGINILFALENEFGIQIPDDAARNVKNLREMAEGVWKLVEEKGTAA
ncbi:MAG TPA: acyl carrier protein [Bryobacteraceae bacterium]|jgi:acyl carrier protein|nr:acyl carrier protein [Bryobacteraceae bacterium]